MSQGFTLHTESLARKLGVNPSWLVHSHFRVCSLYHINSRLKITCPKQPRKHRQRIRRNRLRWNKFVYSSDSDEASYLVPAAWDKVRLKYILDV